MAAFSLVSLADAVEKGSEGRWFEGGWPDTGELVDERAQPRPANGGPVGAGEIHCALGNPSVAGRFGRHPLQEVACAALSVVARSVRGRAQSKPLTSHNCTAPSLSPLPVARERPSGLNATQSGLVTAPLSIRPRRR